MSYPYPQYGGYTYPTTNYATGNPYDYNQAVPNPAAAAAGTLPQIQPTGYQYASTGSYGDLNAYYAQQQQQQQYANHYATAVAPSYTYPTTATVGSTPYPGYNLPGMTPVGYASGAPVTAGYFPYPPAYPTATASIPLAQAAPASAPSEPTISREATAPTASESSPSPAEPPATPTTATKTSAPTRPLPTPGKKPTTAVGAKAKPTSSAPKVGMSSLRQVLPWASNKQGMYNQWVLPKKALIISCSYKGNQLGAELTSTEPYALKMYTLMRNVFDVPAEAITVLCDYDNPDPNTMPSRGNIKQAILWLTWQTKPGDQLFFYYIGHGGIQPHLNIDTEGIVPNDWEKCGYFKGRELQELLVNPLPEGSKMFLFLDCLNSGIHLPNILEPSGEVSGGDIRYNLVNQNQKKGKKEKKEKKSSKGLASVSSSSIVTEAATRRGFVVQFACASSLFSVQSTPRPGHFTEAVVSAMGNQKGGPGKTYVEVCSKANEMIATLPGDTSIVVELSTNGELEIYDKWGA